MHGHLRRHRRLHRLSHEQGLLINLDIQSVPDLTSGEVEQAVDRVEREVQTRVPDARHVFIEAESLGRQPERLAG